MPDTASRAGVSRSLGSRRPGLDSHGISIPGFLKAYPDNRSAYAMLFAIRGGHEMKCRLCGQATSWKQLTRPSIFQSRCCFTTLNAARGTPFFRLRKPLWLWLYTIVLILNLSASPSGDFLARHLDLDRSSGWFILSRIREQFSLMCRRGQESLRGKRTYVEEIKVRGVLSANGRSTTLSRIMIVATAGHAFAYVIPKRHPANYRALFDHLGLDRELFTYDFSLHRYGPKIGDYSISLLSQGGKDEPAEDWAAFGNGRSLAVYLSRSLNKWLRNVRRTNLQAYLDEFVLRYNFADDKAMLFPLFLQSLGRVEYCDEAEARSKVLCFHSNAAPGLP